MRQESEIAPTVTVGWPTDGIALVTAGRMGRPEEGATVIASLASPAACYGMGTDVVVDGGFTKRVQF